MKSESEKFKITQIAESFYGCEESFDEIKVDVFLEDKNGNITIFKESDNYLYENNINEGDFVFIENNKIKKATF